MIKFRDKASNIDETYNILKIGLSAKEWNVLLNNFRTPMYSAKVFPRSKIKLPTAQKAHKSEASAWKGQRI
jgi:hypothetical protein